MSFSLVQSKLAKSAAAQLSYNLAFTSNVTVGNLLIVAVCKAGGATLTNSVSDTLGNSWNSLTAYTDSANGVSTQIFWAVANASGACTITVTTPSGSAIYTYGLGLYEVNDSAGGTWALDGTPTGVNGVNTTANPSIGTMTVLANSFALVNGDINGSTNTAGTGWTLPSTQVVGYTMCPEYQLATSAGTLNGNYVNASSTRKVGGMAAWKATSTGLTPVAAQATLTGNLPGRMDLGITARTTVKGLT